MKRIALIIPNLQIGGAERVVSNLSIEFQKYYEVSIIVFDSTGIFYPYGGELIDLKIGTGRNIIKKIINLFRRIFKLKTIKKQHKFEVCISFTEGANFVNILSKNNNEKTIISVREYLSSRQRTKYTIIQKWLIKRLYNKADMVISVSELLKRSLNKEYGISKGRVKTIYNLYDVDKIQYLINDQTVINESIFLKPTFISVGRFDIPKGHWHLIRAFSILCKKVKDAQLLLLGDGPLFAYLKKLTHDLNLTDRVFFIGPQKNPFIYINKSSALVSSSLWEGFPNVICEAMACKVPIISTDCRSGPREILAPDTDCSVKTEVIKYASYGILVPVPDGKIYDASDSITKEEELLAKAMQDLIEDQLLMKEYREKSFERVHAFSKNNIINEWIKVINE